ncbi:MAG: quinone-dependent dihydroorotate dehydrogenase [Verrucomicrobia bacterium]|nr:quinone-dependent dihydroorotate dehydrogenase [Verrucomicrobiota bacterium]
MLAALYPGLRPLLFRLDPERAHDLGMAALRLAERIGLLDLLEHRELSKPVELLGLRFPNRIGLAAGLDKNGNTIDALGRLGFGFIEVGTVTPRPQPGNPKPRLFRLRETEAIVNRMGFNNDGIDALVGHVSRARSFRGLIGINIGRNKDTPNESAVEDYLDCMRKAWRVADYLAVNLSSPNTPGLRELQQAEACARLLARLKQEQEILTRSTSRRVPLFFKIAPDLDPPQIGELARVFLDGGLDGLIATNTTLDRKAVAGSRHAEETGGLSGRPLLRKSNEVLSAFADQLSGRIPIIGVGGVSSLEDAREKLRCGASLVQIYTSLIYRGPGLVRELARGL